MKKHKLFTKSGFLPPFGKYVTGLFLLCAFVFFGNFAVAQTVLINPAQEGGFEQGPTFSDNGWTVANDATNTWNLGNTPAWQTGSNCAFVSNNGGTAWAYTNNVSQRSFFYRDIAFPAGETNITLSFDWRAYGESSWDNLSIYIVDVAVTPTNVGPVGSATTNTGWTGYTDGVTGYYLRNVFGSSAPTATTNTSYTLTPAQAAYAAGSTKRLIFVWKNDNGSGTNPPSSVDNISLTSGCSPVAAIAGSGATTNSFNANWTALAGATYNVEYRAVGSLTWIAATGNPYSGTTAAITGLLDNTSYEYRVTALAPACVGYSNIITVTTLCGATNVPYLQNFESVTTPALPACTAVENAGTGNLWKTISTTNGGMNSKVLNYSYNSANDANTWFYLQGINLTAGTSYRLTYKYGTTTYAENLKVAYGLSPAAASMTIPLADHPAIILTAGLTNVVDFIPATTGVYYIGFNAYSTSDQDQLYVDDISVTITPTCFEPLAVLVTDVTENTATVSWTVPSIVPGIGYEYEVRTSGAPGSGLVGLVTSGTTTAAELTANVTGLSNSSTYTIYLRSNCDVTDNSAWTTGTSFSTLCGIVDVPYLQNFESAIVPAMPNCTSVENAGTGNLWKTYSGTSYGFSGKFLRYSYATPAANSWFYTPGVNLVAGTSYRVSYDYGATGATYPEKLKVAYGTSASNVDMTNLIFDHTNVVNATPNTNIVDFVATTTGVYYFGFNAYSIGNQFYLQVDNISIDFTPACATPLALTASTNSVTTATITWNQSVSNPGDGYEYEVRESGAAGSGATGLFEEGSTLAGITSVAITGLTANTTYTVYVRSNCGVGVYSDWTTGATFSTNYCTPAPTSVDGLGITNVTVGAINNTTVAEVGNYGDYSAMSADMALGSNQTVAITYATGYTYETKIWIDFNDDLDFNDAGENVYTGVSTNANPITLNAQFTVPVGVTLGAHRMRIGGQDNGPLNPCYTGAYGTYEDYTVNIVCPTTVAAATSMNAEICTGSSTNLVATGINGAVLTWYDAATAGNVLVVDDTLNTGAVAATTSFWVEQTIAACPAATPVRTEVIVTTIDVIVDLVSTDITCNGLTDGSVSVGTVTCGTAPFMYSIDGGVFGFAPTDLAAGTYSVVIQDANMNESSAMSITITEPFYVTPAPMTTNASVCVDATSGAIVTAMSAPVTPLVISFDIAAQPIEENFSPGVLVSSATMPALPAGAVITSVTLNMNGIVSNGFSWGADVNLATTGAIVDGGDSGTGAPTSSVTFDYTRVLSNTSVDVAGGTVNLMYWNEYDDETGADDATLPLGTGVATITIVYTMPVFTTDFSWWTDAIGGTQVGTGSSLEAIGTSVVASPAVAGTYTLYAQTEANGCNSPTRTASTVAVNVGTSSTVTKIACASPFTYGGQDFTTAGTYTVVIPNTAGCDSTVTLELTFGAPSDSTITASTCTSPFTFNGQDFTTSGTYDVIIPNASGCDSTITLNLTIGAPTDSTVTEITCTSPFTFNGQDFTASGTYEVIIPNASGCDSTITLNLTIATSTPSTITQAACDSYVYNGTTYTQSGSYVNTFTNVAGCDSIVTLNLTINTVSTPVATVDGVTLTASGATGTLIWTNCANNQSVGTGATYTATANGSYAVTVTSSAGCSATSTCVVVNQVGIEKNEMLDGVSIYPNPTTSNVTISMADDKSVDAKVYDAQGKLIYTANNVKNGAVLSLETVENGVYLIHVSNETGNNVFRIVKQ